MNYSSYVLCSEFFVIWNWQRLNSLGGRNELFGNESFNWLVNRWPKAPTHAEVHARKGIYPPLLSNRQWHCLFLFFHISISILMFHASTSWREIKNWLFWIGFISWKELCVLLGHWDLDLRLQIVIVLQSYSKENKSLFKIGIPLLSIRCNFVLN